MFSDQLVDQPQAWHRAKFVAQARPAASKRRWFILFVGLSLLTSCGDAFLPEPIKNPVIKQLGGTPLHLALQDEACQMGQGVRHLGPQTLVHFYRYPQGPARLSVDLHNLYGSQLRSQAIASTTVEADYLIKKNFIDRRLVVSGGRPLRLCQRQGAYQRDSLENAALAMAYGVETAYAAYDSIRHDLGGPSLPKVHLLVLPQAYEEHRSDERVVRRTLTDNAAWFVNPDNGQYYIAVFPHSRERRTHYEGRFWEQPPIMAHEYGHHIYYQLAPQMHRVSSGASSCSLDAEGGINPSPSASKRILHGLEEAFADLYAYYTYQAQAAPLFSGRLHFNQARDIEFPFLAVGEDGRALAKSLRTGYLEAYLNPPPLVETPARGGLPQAVLQDEHSLGAILAYSLNRFFQASASAESLMGRQDEAVHKLRNLVRWAQSMGAHSLSLQQWGDSQADHLLAEIILLAIEVVMQHAAEPKRLSLEQCQALADGFPAFMDDWVVTRGLRQCAAWR